MSKTNGEVLTTPKAARVVARRMGRTTGLSRWRRSFALIFKHLPW